MPVGTITEAKELALTYQPLLLAEFSFRTGPKLWVASHPLNVTEGGFQYAAHDWLARVMSYDITATQALSESGIDYTPQVTVTMADVNRDIQTNFEDAVGFKGAVLKLTFIFWNVGANEFSTDSLVKFVGVCGTPQIENDSITVTATSLMNMSQAMLPQVRIQKRCPSIFPITGAERQDAATDESSPFYPCGYSPDASGGCGNLNGGVPFTRCSYTYADCLVRLGNGADITKDSSNRPTGRFGGIQWSVPNSYQSRGYVSGKWEDITTTDNEAKYGDLVPLHYGTGWTDPLVLTTDGSSADFTKMHVLLGWGKFSDIMTVLVNGTVIPHTYNDTEMSYVGKGVPGSTEAHKSGWWKAINNGDRNGSIAENIKLEEQPDPYGNLCVIEVVVPRKLADSSSMPRVQVLATGPAIAQYRRITSATVSGGVATLTFPTANNDFASNDVDFAFEVSGNTLGGINGSWTHLTGFTYGPPGTATFSAPGCPDGTGTGGWVRWMGPTDNLAWVLLDVLTWANWRYSQIDAESFVDFGDVCRTEISYRDQFGVTRPNQKRYTASLILRQRRSASEVVRGLRNAGKCLLYLDTNGKLAVKAKQTLASQQPSPVPGSNYADPVASKLVDGTTANGYVAYDFHEGNIAKKSDKKTPSLVVTQRGLNDAPNVVTVNYQDRDNRYVPDSLTVKDYEDVSRTGQELTGQMPLDGINNLDQGRRCIATWMAENYRGNPRLNDFGETTGDTGGTRTYEWETTFKVIHLNVGDICRLSYQHLAVTNQLVRIIKIQPTSNFSRVKITALHHNDLWYLDSFGQEDAPLWRPDFRNREMRPAYAWCPHFAQPPVNDSMYGRTDWGFGIAQDYDAAADGTAIAKLVITGKLPVNVFSEDTTPPFVGIQGTTVSTGGTIAGGRTFWFAVCSKDAAGKLSAPSRIMAVAVPSGTNTNTVTVRVSYWPSDATGWVLFGGGSPMRLCFQSEGTGKPATLTLTDVNAATWGAPDSEFNRMLFRVKRAVHSGVWGQVVTGKTANTVTVPVDPASPFTADQWAGYDLTLLAQTDADAVALPVWNAQVASNTTDGVLTLAGTHPDTADLHAGDVVVLRFKPTVGIDAGVNYIQDAGIANAYYPDGMIPGAEKGSVLFFIAGTGRGMSVKVKDNTATRYYIEGKWPVTPDATSRFIVLEPMWQMEVTQEAVNNAVADTQVPMVLDATNYRNQVIFVQAYTMDGGGDESFPADSPFREIYLFGEARPTVVATEALTLTPNSQNVQADASAAPFTITLPPFAAWRGLEIGITKTDETANVVTWQTSSGDDVVVGIGETGSLTEYGQSILIKAL